MPRRATKDTFGLEVVGGAEIRRVVKAGDIVPDHYVLGEGEFDNVEAGEAGTTVAGLPYPEANEPADEIQAESLENTRRLQDEASAVQQEPQVTPGAPGSRETEVGESAAPGRESSPQRLQRQRQQRANKSEGASTSANKAEREGAAHQGSAKSEGESSSAKE